jgi:acyl-CoA reductase-like NAD-dependent aldehyde dehydrogenase
MTATVASDLLLTQACIDGAWVGADSGATFAVLDPATGETIAGCSPRTARGSCAAGPT